MSGDADWFEVAFGELYPVIYAHRSEEQAAEEVAFLARVMGLREGASVLDLACGEGRHQRALQDLGLNTFGLDYSRALLERHRAHRMQPVVRGDMRRLPFGDGVFDHVTQLFTAFGYFATDEEDQGVLREVQRILRPRGTHALDFLDVDHVVANLVPHSQREAGSYLVDERRRIEDGRVIKTVSVRSKSGEERLRYDERVRLYDRATLTAMMERSGLRVIEVYGEFADVPAGKGKRCLLIAERAA